MIKSMRMRCAGHAARMEKRNAYRILVGKPEGKRPLGRPRRRWEDNIKMGRKEIEWGCLEWIQVAWHTGHWRTIFNTVMNLRIP
jgi:hypothetical protein